MKGPQVDVVGLINAKVSADDLLMMQKFGLENSDGNIDKAEFITLCMLRLGAVDPELVAAIVNRYDELDVSKDGVLSYKELLEVGTFRNYNLYDTL